MADEQHLAKLKEGVEAWNHWREDNPSVKPDLFGENLRGANLGKANLRMAGLVAANLIRANLRGAALFNANLRDADLTRADLTRAGLRWADLRGADLIGANLRGADLYSADLAGADLGEANLSEANLSGAYLSGADLSGARLVQANLEGADVTGVTFSRSSRQRAFQGIRVSTCYGSQQFKSFAQDQDYIEELRSSGRWGAFLFRVWWLFADCGRSFLRWAAWSLFFALAFAFAFYRLGADHFKFDQLPLSFTTTIYYSVVTFTTLGFGDIVPKTSVAAMLVMAEVVLGYVMLGGLISIFANKVARRS